MSTPFDLDDTKGKFLSQGQVGMVRSGLNSILTNAERVQESPGITSEEKGWLELIKKDTHGILRILRLASWEGGKFLSQEQLAVATNALRRIPRNVEILEKIKKDIYRVTRILS